MFTLAREDAIAEVRVAGRVVWGAEALSGTRG